MSRMIFISFNYQNMVNLRELLPEGELQFLWHGDITDDLLKKLTDHNLDLDIHHKNLTKEALDTFHANGIKVNVWTVDDPERAEELVSWGVDFITSNILQ